MNFGEKLKVIRRSLGLTQQEFADRLGTTKQAISRYENSERDPNLRTAKLFSDNLGIDLTLLADDSLYLPTSEKIKEERRVRGWSLENLANRIHISPERLSSIESGEIFPTSLEVSSLSKVFCASADWLLGIGFDFDNDHLPLSSAEQTLLLYFRELNQAERLEVLEYTKNLATPPSPAPVQSVEDLEEEYKKRHSASASTTISNASSITTDAEKAAGEQ